MKVKAGQHVAFLGDSGNDSINGAGAQDRIFAGQGDDIIVANDGVYDRIYGGDGNDSADIDAGLDNPTSVETLT